MAEISQQELANLQQGMTDQQKMLFITQYNAAKKDRTLALVLSFFFGVFGIDRFYIGDVGIGIAKFCTLGFFFLGAVIDLFFIMRDTDDKNRKKAQEIVAAIKLSASCIVSPDQSAGVEDAARKCPFCAETIKHEARVCRFCNRELPSA